jgi:GDPmannose 4,6-dehydratase
VSRILITGAAGQDGSYLAEQLLGQGHEVWGFVRPHGDGWPNLAKARAHPDFHLYTGDILDPTLPVTLATAGFDAIYHLAGQTHVMQAYAHAPLTLEVNTLATARLLDALLRSSPKTRFYFAASSEMFAGMEPGTRAAENHPLCAHSPYAVSKIAAFQLCTVFRQQGLFIVSGIGFNHESRRRGREFVTRKIGLGVREWLRTGTPVTLGNTSAYRDWHHAEDTVRGMVLAMEQDTPDDFVFASGTARSVEDYARAACDLLGADFAEAIRTVPSELRPWDVNYLCGDPSKAHARLGWTRTHDFPAVVLDTCHAETPE